jgi:hypothetical protein
VHELANRHRSRFHTCRRSGRAFPYWNRRNSTWDKNLYIPALCVILLESVSAATYLYSIDGGACRTNS